MKKRAVMLTIQGCSACEEFKPRFEDVMKANGYEYQILDVLKDKEGAAWGKIFEVNCFPTTIIFGSGEAKIIEGNVGSRTLNERLTK